VMFKTIYLHNC